MNQILIHNGNNDYKLPQIGNLKIEKAVGGNISMRLPCHALVDGGALDCQYITTRMSNGKFVVVLGASHRRRHFPSLSNTPMSVTVTVAIAVAIVVAVAVAVAVLPVAVILSPVTVVVTHRRDTRCLVCPAESFVQ